MAKIPLAHFLLDATAKATVLLLAAMVATGLLRRSSAAVRHRIWCLTFVALALLPGLSAALPEWRLAVLPKPDPSAPESTPFASRSPLAPQAEGALTTQTPLRLESDFARHPAPLAEQAGYGVAEQSGSEPPPTPIRPPNLAAVWLIGALVALLPLVAGLARTLLLRQRSLPINDASWAVLLGDLRQRLALARRVGLYENASALMPMTWGVLRPVVMLPRHAHEWTDRLRRIVLLHELAHVKRCDVGFQLLGRVACALYWFHPLAWYALRRLRIEREFACDDCVVLAGERATEYAAELLQIARAYRTVPFAAAVAMAQRSNLEHRLRALFDRACSHLPVSARMARVLFAGMLILATTVAAVRLAPQTSAASDGNDAAELKVVSAPPDVAIVRGRVVAPNGRPVPGAKIYLSFPSRVSRRPVSLGAANDSGRFEFRIDRAKLDLANPVDTTTGCSLVAMAEGFGLDWVELRKGDNGREHRLRLVEDVPIRGRIVNVDGRPVGGAKVRLRQLGAPAKGLDDYIAAMRDGLFGGVFYPFERTCESLPGTDEIAVDADGRFTLRGLGAERVAELTVEGPGIEWWYVKVMTRETEPVEIPRGAPGLPVAPRPTHVYGTTFEHVASFSKPIVGTVRDAASGEPIAGVKIRTDARSDTTNHEPTTDSNGRFEVFGHPKIAQYEVIALPDGLPYFTASAKAGDTPGFEPITIDLSLTRGIPARGRVVETDGRPSQGTVEYHPLRPNPVARGRGVQGGRSPRRPFTPTAAILCPSCRGPACSPSVRVDSVAPVMRRLT